MGKLERLKKENEDLKKEVEALGTKLKIAKFSYNVLFYTVIIGLIVGYTLRIFEII